MISLVPKSLYETERMKSSHTFYFAQSNKWESEVSNKELPTCWQIDDTGRLNRYFRSILATRIKLPWGQPFLWSTRYRHPENYTCTSTKHHIRKITLVFSEFFPSAWNWEIEVLTSSDVPKAFEPLDDIQSAGNGHCGPYAQVVIVNGPLGRRDDDAQEQ